MSMPPKQWKKCLVKAQELLKDVRERNRRLRSLNKYLDEYNSKYTRFSEDYINKLRRELLADRFDSALKKLDTLISVYDRIFKVREWVKRALHDIDEYTKRIDAPEQVESIKSFVLKS